MTNHLTSASLQEQESTSPAIPEALQAPSRLVSAGFVSALTLSNFFLWISIVPVLQLLLPEQVGAIDEANKAFNLGVVTSIGALLSLIANPLAGALSDRTTSRLGRRRPWILAGAILTSLALAILWQAHSLVALIIGWGLVQLFSSCLQAAVGAIIPDQVPMQQRGTIAGIIGMATPAGGVLGVVLIGQAIKSVDMSYLILMTLPLIVLVPYALFLKEKALPEGYLPPFRLGVFLKNFWINPRTYPDFCWAWLARFIVFSGYFAASGYLYYYLEDTVHYSQLFPGQTVAQGASILSLISLIFLIVSSIVGGFLSDRFQHRKLLVFLASFTIALSLLLMGLFPSWHMVIIATCLQNVGFGCYLAVHLALTTLVLPSEGNRGKDLGILNMASVLPQFLAPIVAGGILSMTHNSYPVLFIIAAMIALVGAFPILPVRSIR